MEFCKNCDNVMFMQASGGRVVHRCHCCQAEEQLLGAESKCVGRTSYARADATMQGHIGEHVFDDPTLPCVDMIPCPNPECTRPADAPERVIFIKHDAVNMKYMYCCAHCRRFWAAGGLRPPFQADGKKEEEDV